MELATTHDDEPVNSLVPPVAYGLPLPRAVATAAAAAAAVEIAADQGPMLSIISHPCRMQDPALVSSVLGLCRNALTLYEIRC